MGIPQVSETVERLWNGWELRMVMLLSLYLQIFLILFGRRRKYTAGFWIGKPVWNSVYSEMNELLRKFEKFSNSEFFEMTDERLVRERSKGKLTSISLKRLLGKGNIQSSKDVGADLKDFIFKHLLDKRTRYNLRMRFHDPGRNDLHEILSERGDEVIGRMESLENFGWSVKFSDFNESILAWHIATDICHRDDVRINGVDAESIRLNTEISIELSNYMVYLLLDCPYLLPRGIGKERYNQTCSAVDDHAELLDRIISGQHDSCMLFGF
ncbi:hypothetical protein OIU84_011798 [Salix udensis]|uniref:Uncharacterized protein n=1 Tax=Salix udensis TaxID=889485 RepID=A0AAD6JPE8_9ROSI|nr:hypothetical protein OIU84_011798 [Salix udensis]